MPRVSSSSISTFFRRHRPLWMFVLFGTINLQFRVLEKTVVPRYWISCSLDAYIPFVPVFVIPYVAWFGIIAAALIVLYFHDAGDFVRTSALLCAGMGVAVTLYALFPHGQLLRPAILGDDVFSRFIGAYIYAYDTNTNCCPSIHVLNQMAIHLGLCQSRLLRNHRGWKVASAIVTVLVCASTVLIKQHSLLDVLAALLLIVPLYLLVYHVNWRRCRRGLRFAS